MRPSHPAHHRPYSPAPSAAARPKTLSGNLQGAQPNDIRVVRGSFRCNGTAWPADLTSAAGTYVIGGAVCGARVSEGPGRTLARSLAGRGSRTSLRKAVCTCDVCSPPTTLRGAPYSAADLCRAYNRTCPTASAACQGPAACDPASGTCSAPSLPNGTLCTNGSCLAGDCTGEGWVCKR
jgi:hypothetical protein